MQKRELGKGAEIDLGRGHGGVLEVAGGAGIGILKVAVVMQKIDEQRDSEKGQQEHEVQAEYMLFYHTLRLSVLILADWRPEI
jgi:hypothetical protein